MEGVVTSYSSLTLVFTADYAVGSGTFSTWTLSLTGNVGATGTTGSTGSTGVTGAGYGGTSTTSAVIGNSGSKTLTLAAPASGVYAYAVGSRIRAANDPTHYMEGVVTAFNTGTQVITFTADLAVGSGTFTSWTVGLAGDVGTTGTTGTTGAGYGGTSTTSAVIGNSGSKTLTLATPASGIYAYVVGSRVRAANDATHYMEGVVTAFNTGTQVLTFTADNALGVGTFTSWTVGLAGDVGATGTTGTTGAAGAGYGGTSTSSQTLGNSGTKTFTLSAGTYAYASGSRVRAFNDATHYMEGVVTSLTSLTLVFTADYAVGSGTFTSWTIGLVGDVGSQGTTGTTGAAGAGYGGTSTSSLVLGGSGTKTVVLAAGTYAYVAGVRVRVSNSATNYMEGIVSSYTSGTLTLIFTADYFVGSGTFTSWTVAVTGNVGPGYGGTSTSSVAMNFGDTPTFVLNPGFYAYTAGLRVRAVETVGGDYMEGYVTAFTPSTYTLSFLIDYTTASGTFTAWTMGIAGELGLTGSSGATGSAGVDGGGYGGTSTSSVALGASGTKTFVLSAGTYVYNANMRVRAAKDGSNYMEGVVVSYTSGTLTLVFTADRVVGSGTYTSWTLGLVGDVGAAGSAGSTGAAGGGYGGSSTTSVALGATGTKTFTLASATYAYTAGMRVRAFNDATHYMEGVVSSYSALSLAFTADYVVGTGTFTSWTIGLAGDIASLLSTEYTTAGTFTYTIPAIAKFLDVVFCGAGGGGGAGNNGATSVFGGGGGGGAGMCRFETIPVDSDTTVTVVTGAAGLGATGVSGDAGGGAATTLTLGSRVLTAQPGGGGAGVFVDGQSGAGGGSGGSGGAGGTIAGTTAGAAGSSSSSGGFLPFSVAGLAGGSGSTSSGPGVAGTDATAHSNSLYLPGGGGGGGSAVSNAGGKGGDSASGYAGGAGGLTDTIKGPGGGGGASGLAAGGRGGSSSLGAPVAGTKGSGGGGGRGGTGATWTAGADGGAGYVHIRPR
jgi:hypothetical protein